MEIENERFSVTGAGQKRVHEHVDLRECGHLPPVDKPDFIRPLGNVDALALQNMVAQLSETVWDREDQGKPNNFACFHHTAHILFRFIPRNENAAEFVSYMGWPLWKPLLWPIMTSAVKAYEFKAPAFPKVMLARLAAGERIDLHRDGPGSNLQTHKIHVPILTDDNAFFLFDDRKVHLPFGQAFEVNNLIRHGGINLSQSDRVHLIFEVFDASRFEAFVLQTGVSG